MITRIMVCCDNPIFSHAMTALLAQQPDFVVAGESRGASAVARARELRPDAILVFAPALTIPDHPHELERLAELSKVVLVALAGNTSRSFDALRLGVRAVLSPSASLHELLNALRTVVEGDSMVIPGAARESLDSIPEPRSPQAPSRMGQSLTAREREVLLLLTRGSSNAEIAEKLSLSPATVRSHVHNLLRKLDVGTRAQAVALAYENGLVKEIEGEL